MLNILSYFSSIEFYSFALILIIIGAITQSAIGIGFGLPACFLVLFEPSMVPSCIVLMGTFLAFSNAFLSLKDVVKMDLAYSFSGRVIGSLISIPIISLTIGTKSYLIFFGVLLLITVFLSAKKWNVVANKKNITIAGACSGFMGTLIGIGGPPIPISVPIKPEQAPAIVIFFLFAIKLHFFALKKTVIKSNIPKIIK